MTERFPSRVMEQEHRISYAGRNPLGLLSSTPGSMLDYSKISVSHPKPQHNSQRGIFSPHRNMREKASFLWLSLGGKKRGQRQEVSMNWAYNNRQLSNYSEDVLYFNALFCFLKVSTPSSDGVTAGKDEYSDSHSSITERSKKLAVWSKRGLLLSEKAWVCSVQLWRLSFSHLHFYSRPLKHPFQNTQLQQWLVCFCNSPLSYKE